MASTLVAVLLNNANFVFCLCRMRELKKKAEQQSMEAKQTAQRVSIETLQLVTHFYWGH